MNTNRLDKSKKNKELSNVSPLKKSITAIVCLFIIALIISSGIYLLSKYFGGSLAQSFDYPKIRINEIMTSNDSAYPAEDGSFYDWIELYNYGSDDADLSKLFISKSTYKYNWQFPNGTTLHPDEYIVIFCSGEKKEGLYAPFKLSKEGTENIFIKAKDGTIIDSVTTEPLQSNYVMQIDSDNQWSISDSFTPGFENSEKGIAEYYESLKETESDIIINEVMAKNKMTLQDCFGEYSDWIELKNISNKIINLSSYYLTQDLDNRYSNRLPDIDLKPEEIIVIYASGRGIICDNKECHLNFKLSEYGESVYLVSSKGKISSSVTYKEMSADMSYALSSDDYEYSRYPTPGFENTTQGYNMYQEKSDKEKSLLINEVMVKNTKYLKQNGGRYYDWIELYNKSNQDINLSDYHITKSLHNQDPFYLPEKILKPGEYFIIIASGDPALSTNAYTHANFKINGEDDELYLCDNNDKIIDSLHIFNIPVGYSLSRVTGYGGFFYCETPTPGGATDTLGYRRVSDCPEVTTAEGVYNNVEYVSVKFQPISDSDIYYTLDNTPPDDTSKLYDGKEIILTKTTIIRAVAYSDDKIASPVMSYSYIINENHTLEVVSLVTDPDNLWSDDKGIYANGPGWTEDFPHKGANFWMDWEIPAHISLFDGDKGFSYGCGVKIFGNWGRGKDQKSLLIKFKEIYGPSELHYQLFDDYNVSCFNSFILRSGSQDQSRSKMRDELFSSLSKSGMDSIYVQQYKPCILYLNGEYWGIYFIREKISANTLSQYLNVSPESIDILYNKGSIIDGTNKDYLSFMYFIKNNDMSEDKNYKYAESKMDMISYIDFKIAEAFCSNVDQHNIKYYKSSETDGKWRWILYDLDFAFRSLDNTVEITIKDDYEDYSNTLIASLLKNEKFRDLYLSRWNYHLKNTYNTEKILSYVNNLQSMLEPEMQRNCEKWGPDYTDWIKYVNVIKVIATGNSKIKSRRAQVIEDLTKLFDLTDDDVNKYFGDLEY